MIVDIYVDNFKMDVIKKQNTGTYILRKKIKKWCIIYENYKMI